MNEKASGPRESGEPTDPVKGATSIARVLLAAGGARLFVLPLTGLCAVATARVITKAVGIEQFGVVMLVATLSQFLAFADLGAGAAVATARAQADEIDSGVASFRGILLTAVRTTLASGALLASAAVLLGVLGAWPRLLGIQHAHLASSMNLSAVLALSAFAAALPFAVGEAVLRGAGRVHEAVLLLGISPPTALLLAIAFRQIGVPAFAYALVLPAGALVAAMACAVRAWWLDREAFGNLLRNVLRPFSVRGLPIAATAVPMFIVMIGLPIALQSDRIIIAHRLDEVGLSNYSYASQLYLPLWSVVSVAALALWPHFAAGVHNQAALRKGWLTGIAMLGGAGTAIAVGFLLLARYVIGWMSNGEATPSWSLLVAFALLLIVQSIHVTTGILLIEPGKLRFQAKCVIALVLTNLPLSWILTPSLGAAGPVFASAITVLLCQLLPGIAVAAAATRPTDDENTRGPRDQVDA